MTVPSALRSGSAARSSSSACRAMASSSLSRLVRFSRRDRDGERVAAELLDLHVVLQQFLQDPVGVGLGLVDLVDGDDDRRVGGLGVFDRLDRLRHHAVVGGHHQDDDVGDLCAAGAHRGERGVAGRVDEGDLGAAGRDHLIGADVLGDAAGLAGDDVGVADRVEQRGLAVVDVAHDGDDGRARHRLADVLGAVEQALLDVGFGDALDGVAHILGDQLRGVGVERIGQRHHAALTHQQFDDVDGALGHAVGEFLDADRLRQHDLAADLLLGLGVAVALEPLGAAAERGDRARALVLGRGRGGDGETAALTLVGAARRARRRQQGLHRRRRGQGAADDRLRPGGFLPRGLRARGGGDGRDRARRGGGNLARQRRGGRRARRRRGGGELPPPTPS